MGAVHARVWPGARRLVFIEEVKEITRLRRSESKPRVASATAQAEVAAGRKLCSRHSETFGFPLAPQRKLASKCGQKSQYEQMFLVVKWWSRWWSRGGQKKFPDPFYQVRERI